MRFRNTLVFIILVVTIILSVAPAGAADLSCIISVTSIPDDSLVRIDGMQRGTTPFSTSISCGNHTVAIEKGGYMSYSEVFFLPDGEHRRIVADLEYKSRSGSVLVRSQPAGGTLYIDGKYRGLTPLLAENLMYGRHTVLIKKAGYLDYDDIVTAGPGGIPEYTEYLVPEPRTGYLGISSLPAGGDVYLDGEYFGITPTRLEPVPAGNHTFVVMKDGYRNYTSGVTIAGAESLQVNTDLQILPATGELVIDSVPTGADVYLNGIFKALTPAVFEDVPAGNYSLLLRLRNHSEMNTAVTLNGGETRELLVWLAANTTDTGTFSETVYTTFSNTTPLLPGMVDNTPAIDRNYTWYTNGHEATIRLRIPQDLYDYYKGLKHQPQTPDEYAQYALSDKDRQYLHDLIGMLKDAGGNKQLAARGDYRNVVSFVQSIVYADDIDPVTKQKTEYWKYPVETLADGNGDCEDTAILTAALLKEMGYDVALVLLEDPTQGHAAVGVACDNCNGYYYPLDGKRYYYLETTGAGFSLGSMDNDKYKETSAKIIPI